MIFYKNGDKFEGKILNTKDCKLQAVGQFKFNNGSTYKGQIVNGNFEGEGELLINPSQILIKGNWTKNKLTNPCHVIYIARKMTFKGNLDDKLMRFGQGVLQFEQGSILEYEGEFQKDDMSGQGTIKYRDGSWFKGCFSMNKPHGKGIYFSEHIQYEGDFEYGIFHGNGTLKNNNSTFEGQFKQGVKEGKGVLRFQNNEKYEGYFQGDQMSGQGSYMYRDGSIYVGEFSNNRKEGNGELIIKFQDGIERFQGTFKEGSMNGFGSYFLLDGNIYQGDFNQNFADGKGKIMFNNGHYMLCNLKKNKKNGPQTYFIIKNKEIIANFQGVYKNDVEITQKSIFNKRL